MADALSYETRVNSGAPHIASGRATAILVDCQQPPRCNQCDNAAFRRRRQDGLITTTKRTFAGLHLQYVESVGKFGPNYQSHYMQLHYYIYLFFLLDGSSTGIIPCNWTSGQFHTGGQRFFRPGRCYWQFLLTLHPLQRSCLQCKTDAVYGKAVFC